MMISEENQMEAAEFLGDTLTCRVNRNNFFDALTSIWEFADAKYLNP